MRALLHPGRLPGRQAIPRSTAGLGLIELMVVVTIISMLLAVAVPAYQQVQKKARAAALVNDLRVFSAVFLAYAHENGAWPLNAAQIGQFPPGLTVDDLQGDAWSNPTIIGGHFDWQYNPNPSPGNPRAALAITDTSDAPLVIDPVLFQEMDQGLDDGDLTKGNFIYPGPDGSPLFILEP